MSGETKWTPGPWVAHNAGSHWNNPAIENWVIHWSDYGECVVDHVYEKSDAYLIAAAPDLYEALDDLRSSCKALGLDRDLHQELYNARAALAKARGESQ